MLKKFCNFDFKVSIYTTVSGCNVCNFPPFHIIQAIAAKQSLRASIFLPPQNLPATQIVQLKAQDNDTGRNGFLTYGILNGHGLKFRINETTGILYSTAPFDYEEEPTEYQVCFRFLKSSLFGTLYLSLGKQVTLVLLFSWIMLEHFLHWLRIGASHSVRHY